MARDVIPALECNELIVSSKLDMRAASTLILDSSASFERDGQIYHFSAYSGKAGGSAGYVTSGNTGVATLPASTGASTFVIPLTLRQGDIITAFRITGQMESAGNANVLDADLRATTAATADITDASIGAITQISKTADYEIDDAKSGLSHTVITGNQYYVLVTGTTLAATDQVIMGIEVTVSRR